MRRRAAPVVLFCLLMHVPLRIEAVIKILTFRVFIFFYVLILIESSDTWPFSWFKPFKGHLFFAPSHPPCHSSGKSSRAQPQLAPQRPAHCGALGTAHRMPPHAVTASAGLNLAMCAARRARSQTCGVCRMHTSRLPAEHPTTTHAFDCLTPHR